MEFCVSLDALILLGVLNLTGVMSWITNRPTPGAAARQADRDAGARVWKARAVIQSRVEKFAGNLGVYQTLRPLVVGLVHGLAGSAAVALLVLSTIKSPLWSTAVPAGLWIWHHGGNDGDDRSYFIASGLFAEEILFNVNRHLTIVSGMASVAFGMFLVYQIGFVDGLFSSHVHWIPQ